MKSLLTSEKIALTATLAFSLLVLNACERTQSDDEVASQSGESATGSANAGEVGGSAATAGQSWRIETEVTDGELRLRVEPTTGFKINEEFPWQLQVGEAQIGGGDAERFDEDAVEMALPTPQDAEGSVEGQLRFSVCNDTTCLTPRETVRWEL